MTLALMMKIVAMAACAGLGFRLGWETFGSVQWLIKAGTEDALRAWDRRETGGEK